jgi:ATP-dependent DNA helicase RecG
MSTGSDVELIDRPDGNQFIARIWRTAQKDESTTQKANEELISATQKEEKATQKDKLTTQKPLNATQKRILDYLDDNPKATRQEVADALGGITVNGVKFNIGLLQQYGALKRKGGRKDGEWVVLRKDKDDNEIINDND